MKIRVGTFNCENLFSRSRILDFNATPAQAAQATAALKAAEQLKTILNKKTFTPADKTKILALIKQGKGFFTVEEDRGRLLKGNKVVAHGVDDFVGHIRFAAQDVSSVATDNTAKVIKALNADVTDSMAAIVIRKIRLRSSSTPASRKQLFMFRCCEETGHKPIA